MLFIGDMHCTSKIIDRLVETVRLYIASHSDEETVIFLGDFVYHFSYDRRALAKCFELFVELYKQGKQVYVLAGNHDWIAGQFVFQEGKVLSELWVNNQHKGKLVFITEPMIETIEEQQILFLPFFLLEEQDDKSRQFSTLFVSSSIQEQRSARVNEYLLQTVDEWKKSVSDERKLLICHHRYFNNTIFPWQAARFSFRSPALSEHFLDDSRLMFISGHLHKPFVHKNYCCCGSVRSTSPLEVNQMKYLWQRNSTKITATPIRVNPYIQIQHTGGPYEQETLNDALITIQEDAHADLQGENWSVSVTDALQELDYAWLSLIITYEQGSDDILAKYVTDELAEQLREVTVKQKQRLMHELLANLTDASLDLDKSIADRQGLLKAYLERKYGDDHESYLHVLQNLQIVA